MELEREPKNLDCRAYLNSPILASSDDRMYRRTLFCGQNEDVCEEDNLDNNNQPGKNEPQKGKNIGEIIKEEEDSMGISEVQMSPEDLHSSGEATAEEGLGLGAEDYYASLFSRCDQANTGLVKVSVLLKTLRDLQALLNESHSRDRSQPHLSNCNDELEDLRNVLDPNDEDPVISLPMFVEGMTAYLEKREWSCLSPVKRKSEASFVCASSPQRKSLGQKPLDFDVSKISMPDEDRHNFSLEGFGGITAHSLDFQSEIQDLQLQLQKQKKDNESLKNRLKDAHDENYNLLRVQRDEVNKCQQHEQELKINSERVKLLEEELVERKAVISNLEDKIANLEAKSVQLENQCALYMRERRDILIENEDLKIEVKKTTGILAVREELIARLKTTQCSTAKDWVEKEKLLKDHNESLTQALNELQEKNLKLELEKSDLENRMNMLMHIQTEAEQRSTFQNSPSYAQEEIIDETFEMSADDIEAELLAVQSKNDSPLRMLKRGSGLHNPFVERFDVAVQCEKAVLSEMAVQCEQKESIDMAVQCDKNECVNATVQCEIEEKQDVGVQLDKPEVCNAIVQCNILPESLMSTEKDQKSLGCFANSAYNFTKRSLSTILILFGMLVFLDVPIHALFKHSRSCFNPSFFQSARLYFASCGDLTHEELPII